MIKRIREQFNKEFSAKKYNLFIDDLISRHPGDILFRVAETPLFISKDFTKKIIDACEAITDVIVAENFKALTSSAIPPEENVPAENEHTHFIAFDFGICENEDG